MLRLHSWELFNPLIVILMSLERNDQAKKDPGQPSVVLTLLRFTRNVPIKKKDHVASEACS
jgi:hypothetical protein